MLGRERLQAQLHYAHDRAQQSFEALDAATAGCTQRDVGEAFASEGWLGTPAAASAPLGHPAVVFAGRHSEVIGAANIRAAAQAWGAPVVWFEDRGHFVYWEEPQRFVREVIRFLSAPRSSSTSHTMRNTHLETVLELDAFVDGRALEELAIGAE